MLKSILRLRPKMQSKQCRQRLYDMALLRRPNPGPRRHMEELQSLTVPTELRTQPILEVDVGPVPPLPPILHSSGHQRGGIGTHDWLYSEQWQAGFLDLFIQDNKMFIVQSAYH